MTRATFAWTAERNGNLGHITEHRPDGSIQRWIIPANSVPAFLRARRQLVHHKMSTLMSAQLIPDADYDYLEPSHDTVQSVQSPGPRPDPSHD